MGMAPSCRFSALALQLTVLEDQRGLFQLHVATFIVGTAGL
jgi:hypothetical protein